MPEQAGDVTPAPPRATPARHAELQTLRDQAAQLQAGLEEIQRRIYQFESRQGDVADEG